MQPTNPDEIEFYAAVKAKTKDESVREIISRLHPRIHYKRCWRYLEKWSDRGWYEWGVCMDLGWLTPTAPEQPGRQEAHQHG